MHTARAMVRWCALFEVDIDMCANMHRHATIEITYTVKLLRSRYTHVILELLLIYCSTTLLYCYSTLLLG